MLETTEITPGVFVTWYDAPSLSQHAQPGQFVMVDPGTEHGTFDPLLPRAFSYYRFRFASPRDSERQFALLYAVVGRVTEQMATMQPGERVWMTGPLGRGFDVRRTASNLLLVGGGVGIAPLVALADAESEHSSRDRSIVLCFGARSADGVYPAELLPPQVEYQVSTEDGSMGTQGFVTDLFAETGYFEDVDIFWSLQNAAIAGRRDALLDAGWAEVAVLDVGERFVGWQHAAAAKADGERVYIEVGADGTVTEHAGFITEKEHRSRERRKANDGDEDGNAGAASRPSLPRRRRTTSTCTATPPKEAIAESVKASKAEALFGEERKAVLGLLGLPEHGHSVVRSNGDDERITDNLPRALETRRRRRDAGSRLRHGQDPGGRDLPCRGARPPLRPRHGRVLAAPTRPSSICSATRPRSTPCSARSRARGSPTPTSRPPPRCRRASSATASRAKASVRYSDSLTRSRPR